MVGPVVRILARSGPVCCEGLRPSARLAAMPEGRFTIGAERSDEEVQHERPVVFLLHSVFASCRRAMLDEDGPSGSVLSGAGLISRCRDHLSPKY